MIKNPFDTTQIAISKEVRDGLKVLAVIRKSTIQRVADKILDDHLEEEFKLRDADNTKYAEYLKDKEKKDDNI